MIFKDCGPAAFAEAERIVREERRTLIHPFEGENVTLGTGGVGVEFIDAIPDLDAVIVSFGGGGGGLISGVAAAIKQINPRCAVYGNWCTDQISTICIYAAGIKNNLIDP